MIEEIKKSISDREKFIEYIRSLPFHERLQIIFHSSYSKDMSLEDKILFLYDHGQIERKPESDNLSL